MSLIVECLKKVKERERERFSFVIINILADDVDSNAEIHGFWTIENAKCRLNEYLQKEKIKIEYKYSNTGPDNNK